MKRLLVAASALLITTSAFGIGTGNGGRVYFTRGHTAIGGSYYAELLSVAYDENWAAVGTGAAQLLDHGDLLDNVDYRYHSDARMPSPEVSDASGDYGKITMALGYTNPTTHGTYTSNMSTNVVAQLVEVTPDGSGMTSNVIGVGKASPSGSTWTDRFGAATTEGTFLIYPDPAGDMVGKGNYLLYNCAYGGWLGKLTDSDGDGDPTDDAGDYAQFNGGACDDSHNRDYEILGARLYETSGYRGPSNDDSVHWAELGSTGWKPFVLDLANNAAGLNIYSAPEIAAGMVDGTDYGAPGPHHAVWAAANAGSGYDLYLFIDLDNDGNANGSGEQILAFTSAGEIAPDYFLDLELIEDAAGNMVLVAAMLNTWQSGDVIAFIPLADNGLYDGSGTAMIWGGQDTYSSRPSYPLIWDLGTVTQMEVKVNPATEIPEPATLLLVGTSALGILGCLRRRRMR